MWLLKFCILITVRLKLLSIAFVIVQRVSNSCLREDIKYERTDKRRVWIVCTEIGVELLKRSERGLGWQTPSRAPAGPAAGAWSRAVFVGLSVIKADVLGASFSVTLSKN